MKYFYEKPSEWNDIGSIYVCNHPMYNRCTLFKNSEGLGLGIIQEHFNARIKARWWGSIDPWIASDIYSHKNFQEYFIKHASKCDKNKLYPVFKIRAVMWDLRMKPLKREFWEEF